MFIRVFRAAEQKEILINVNMIWKIEVSYAVVKENEAYAYRTTLDQGHRDPTAIKSYKIFAGGETISLFSDPDDPVMKVIEEIYKNAIKGIEPPPEEMKKGD